MGLEPPQARPLHPRPHRRARAHPQPPPLAGRRRPRGRIRHAPHVHLARPRGRHGPPGDDHRQPGQLRHEHHRRRPPRHRRRARARRSSTGSSILEQRTEYYFKIGAYGADLRRTAGRRRLPLQGESHRPERRRTHGPRLGHHGRRPQGRSLRRLRRGPVRGLLGRLLRRPRPDRRPDQGALRELQDLRVPPQEPSRPARSRSRRPRRPSRTRSSAATRRPAGRTSITSRATARTSPSGSRSGRRRWPTTRRRSRCSRTGSSPTSP